MGFAGRSALVGTLASCSVLGYICLYLKFEFELMGLELAGWFTGTFRWDFCGHIYIWPNVHSCCILVLLVLLVPRESEFASVNAEGLLLYVRLHPQTQAPSGLDFVGVCVYISPISASLQV